VAGDRRRAQTGRRGVGARRYPGTILLLVMVGAPAALAAEGRGTIGGRVTDRDVRTPIPSVRVTLRVQPLVPKPSTLPASLSRRLAPAGPRVETSLGTITDSSGEYRFDGVPPGV